MTASAGKTGMFRGRLPHGMAPSLLGHTQIPRRLLQATGPIQASPISDTSISKISKAGINYFVILWLCMHNVQPADLRSENSDHDHEDECLLLELLSFWTRYARPLVKPPPSSACGQK